jgi:hypothetical protein
MYVIENKFLTQINPPPQNIDSENGLAYIPFKPCPSKSHALYIVGEPASGKSSLMTAMLYQRKTKKKPNVNRIYYRFFDKIHLISPSLHTLNLEKLKLNPDRMHTRYSDEILTTILDEMKDGDNENNLIILDDSIRDISRKDKYFTKCVLNRRHCTQSSDSQGQAGLSLWVTSQAYKMMPLHLRVNFSDYILFRTDKKSQRDAIRDELMNDLDKQQQDMVFKLAWKNKYDFLLIKGCEPTKNRYYHKFSKIVIKDDSDSDSDS